MPSEWNHMKKWFEYREDNKKPPVADVHVIGEAIAEERVLYKDFKEAFEDYKQFLKREAVRSKERNKAEKFWIILDDITTCVRLLEEKYDNI